MAAPSLIKKGVTTIVWGTKPGGTNVLAAPSGAIVESFTPTPTNGKPIGTVENGDGAVAATAHLDDGFDAVAKCVYDTALTWPKTGDAITANVYKYGAAGGAITYPCLVDSIVPPEQTRKKEAMITINISYRPVRDGDPT